MNTADLARLELAKRAYKATQAGEAEVQTGVRRARLALTRPKRRRSWFSKGLVFVVLAVGSLAYAKPNAIGEIVEKVLPRDAVTGKRSAGGRLAELAAPVEAAAKLGRSSLRLPSFSSVIAGSNPGAIADSGAVADPNPGAATAPAGSPALKQTSASPDASASAASAGSARANTARTKATLAAALAGSSASSSDTATKAATPTSSWGRVGQALADGNQSEALAALDQLSASGDERTRDKADLGRAQLLMSRGETSAACSLARSLTHRRAGGRIERQAQLLLKNCR